ncbi:MAG: pentapeptide repeat-containing protein [Clostridiaceae bacterium]
MAVNNSSAGNFNYNNIEKKNKNFMYKNLQKSYCYNCDFSGSIFDYGSFRGAHFKTCTFVNCSFKWSEFVGTNLKGSNFNNAVFENTVFDSVKLEEVNFKDAKFNNTIFLCTDVAKAKNLNIKSPGIKIFNEMPQLEINEELTSALINAMKNKYVKASRVLDTKDGGLNLLNVMILLDNFDTAALIKGLNMVQTELDRDFYTLSYIIKFIQNYKEI